MASASDEIWAQMLKVLQDHTNAYAIQKLTAVLEELKRQKILSPAIEEAFQDEIDRLGPDD